MSAQAAMQSLGGYSYYYKTGIERLYRDLLAGEFHPMQASKQKEMLGNFLIGKTLAG
jgi:alkylation response protein AidB-like acyl-CoA dehydrogenase